MPVNANVVRSVQWARSFDWELNFSKGSGLTKPFDTWFPAVEVDLGLADVQSKQFELPTGTVNIPISRSETTVRITFNDDYVGTIEKWLTKWIKDIADFDKGVLPLSECTKRVNINRLSPVADPLTGLKKVLDIYIYDIYPDGTLTDNKNQNSQAKVFSLDFKIVG